MIHVPTIFVSATIGVVLATGVAFAQGIGFFAVQDALDGVLSQLQGAGEDQAFNNPSPDAERTRAVRALTFRVLANTGLDGLTPPGQRLH